MSRKATLGIGMVLATLLVAGPAQAALLTYHFGGVITSVTDPTAALDGAVKLGDSFSGSYSLDSATPDTYPQNAVLGRYISAGAHMDLNVGSIVVNATGDGLLASVWDDDSNWDGFDFTSAPLTVGQVVVDEFGVALTDSTSRAFVSDALPASLDMTAFDGRGFSFNGYKPGGGRFFVDGSVTYFVAPEPDMLILVSLAVAPLLGRRRAR
jgi:hypothetical protein